MDEDQEEGSLSKREKRARREHQENEEDEEEIDFDCGDAEGIDAFEVAMDDALSPDPQADCLSPTQQLQPVFQCGVALPQPSNVGVALPQPSNIGVDQCIQLPQGHGVISDSSNVDDVPVDLQPERHYPLYQLQTCPESPVTKDYAEAIDEDVTHLTTGACTATDCFWGDLPEKYLDIGHDSDDDENSPWINRPAMCEESPEDDFLEEMPSPSPVIAKEHEPLYEGSPIDFMESFTAILSFAQSENISGAGLGRLLSLIGLHLPTNNNFFESSHYLFKLLEGRDDPVHVYYICSICYKSRVSASDFCDTCTDSSKRVDFFIQFPIVPQVTKMYKGPTFVSDIKHKSRRVKKHPNNYEDIYDGEAYKEAEKGLLSEENNISFTWNADGLQIYNSSPYSLTPFFLVVNELPPEKRYLSENMIIAGIWGSAIKPHPNIFLQPIYKDLVTLKNGIDVQFHDDEQLHKIHAMVLCGTCDAPARASFLNMKSHSGFYSCHICLCVGTRPGDATVFPYEENIPLRTMALYEQQVAWAVNNKVILRPHLLNKPECSGIKGPTLLSEMVNDPLGTTAVDSMHALYLGGMRQMLHLWFDHALREEPFSVYVKTAEVNKKMRKMTPPHFIQRFPQAVDKLVYWKASELRAFLFFLSLCVLKGILKQEYYDHFMLFVQGVYLVNTDSVSPEDICVSTMLLNQFVQQFQVLYGLRHMSHNIHMLLHLGTMVKRLAPLCLISCFPFEDMNGRLTRLIHGTRHAGLQIHSNLSIITALPSLVNDLSDDSPTKKFCRGLQRKSMRLKITYKIDKELYCIGKNYYLSAQYNWVIDELVRQNILFQVDTTTAFHRLLKYGVLIVSSSYGRGQRDSSYVNYFKGNAMNYGNVLVFLRIPGPAGDCTTGCPCDVKYVAVLRKLETNEAFKNDNVTISYMFQYRPTADIDIVPVSNLQNVLYKVDLGEGETYISVPPNKYELE